MKDRPHCGMMLYVQQVWENENLDLGGISEQGRPLPARNLYLRNLLGEVYYSTADASAAFGFCCDPTTLSWLTDFPFRAGRSNA